MSDEDNNFDLGRLLGVLIRKQIITKDEAEYILNQYDEEEE